jgi:hypothetical protein
VIGRKIIGDRLIFNDDRILIMGKKPVGNPIIVNPEDNADRLPETDDQFIVDIRNIPSFFRDR